MDRARKTIIFSEVAQISKNKYGMYLIIYECQSLNLQYVEYNPSPEVRYKEPGGCKDLSKNGKQNEQYGQMGDCNRRIKWVVRGKGRVRNKGRTTKPKCHLRDYTACVVV